MNNNIIVQLNCIGREMQLVNMYERICRCIVLRSRPKFHTYIRWNDHSLSKLYMLLLDAITHHYQLLYMGGLSSLEQPCQYIEESDDEGTDISNYSITSLLSNHRFK